MVEVVNPPIVVGLERGTRTPEQDLSEPRLERIFERVLEAERPDVVHVQELLGQPSSILEIARRRGRARRHDAPGLLPALRHGQAVRLGRTRLPEDAGRRGLRRPQRRCAGRRRPPGAAHAPLRAGAGKAEGAGGAEARASRRSGRSSIRSSPASGAPGPRRRHRSRHRRATSSAGATRTSARLRRVDRLVAQSTRVEEIYRTLGVESDRLSDAPPDARPPGGDLPPTAPRAGRGSRSRRSAASSDRRRART